jgi:uncharacterized protein
LAEIGFGRFFMTVGNNKIYVDTSAFYALIDRSDRYHSKASVFWRKLLDKHVNLFTTNYVVWETLGLLQRRIGFEAANLWHRDVLGVIEILWVDADIYQRGYELWLHLGRNMLGMVDCVGFVAMRQNRIEKAFCFKPHFSEYGFAPLTLSSVKAATTIGAREKR